MTYLEFSLICLGMVSVLALIGWSVWRLSGPVSRAAEREQSDVVKPRIRPPYPLQVRPCSTNCGRNVDQTTGYSMCEVCRRTTFVKVI